MTTIHHWILASSLGAVIGFSGCWILLRSQRSSIPAQSPVSTTSQTSTVSREEESVVARRPVSQTHPDIYEILPKDPNYPTYLTAWEENFGVFWNTLGLSYQDQDSIIASDSSRSEFVEKLGVVIGEQWRWRIVFDNRSVVDGGERALVDAKIGFMGLGARDGIYPCFECCLQEIWDVSEPNPKLLDRIRVGIEKESELNGESITHYVNGFDGLRTSKEATLRREEVSWPRLVPKDRK